MRILAKPLATPVAGLLILLLLIFARIMSFDIRRDEQLYATPAVLLRKLSLYRDVFYNHTPDSAWYFYGIMSALGTDKLLLAARLGVFLGWALLGAALLGVTYRLTRSPAMCLFAVVSILANEALLNQTGMAATNNLLVLSAAYLGLGLFVLGTREEGVKPLWVLLGGVFLATAAAVKASAFIFIPLVATAALFLPQNMPFAQRPMKVVVPLAVGGLLGAAPVLAYFAADPGMFLAHVVGFHTGPHVAYWAAQAADGDEIVAMTAAAKVQLAYSIWFDGANLLLIFMTALMVTLLVLSDSWKQTIQRLLGGQPGLILGCLAVAAAMSFLPTPGFPQYFTLPLVVSPLLIALLYAELNEEEQFSASPALVAASAVILLMGLPQLAQTLPRLVSPQSWTGEKSHEAGVAIAREIAAAGVSGKVGTLVPIYPLEGGLEVYPELATGQFAYRTAEYMDPSLRRYYRTTSPAEIGQLFSADPPAAILVGFDAKLEEPLVNYAMQNGYRKIDNMDIADRYGTAVLYIRPGAAPVN